MDAGCLRHRIAIEQRVEVRDADGDLLRVDWPVFADKVPAEIKPLSGRELMAAAAQQSEVTTAITIRWMAGIVGTMRARDLVEGTLYNLSPPVRDQCSGREWLTFKASSELTAG